MGCQTARSVISVHKSVPQTQCVRSGMANRGPINPSFSFRIFKPLVCLFLLLRAFQDRIHIMNPLTILHQSRVMNHARPPDMHTLSLTEDCVTHHVALADQHATGEA